MTVYITKHETQSPPKYHTSANCPMVRGYPNAYRAVPSPPPGYTPCQRNGPLSKLTYERERCADEPVRANSPRRLPVLVQKR